MKKGKRKSCNSRQQNAWRFLRSFGKMFYRSPRSLVSPNVRSKESSG